MTNGQFIFRAQSTADSYNAAAVAMAAAAKRITELDEEGAALNQSQLKRWKDFAERLEHRLAAFPGLTRIAQSLGLMRCCPGSTRPGPGSACTASADRLRDRDRYAASL